MYFLFCYREVTKFCTMLQGHTDQLFSVEWSQCGRYLASVCKDGKIRIFEPRNSTLPISEGGEIVPKKGARIAWVLDGQYLIVTGFSKYVYKLIYLPHGRSKIIRQFNLLGRYLSYLK